MEAQTTNINDGITNNTKSINKSTSANQGINGYQNMAVWFEIAASDFDRAVKFYQTILNIEIDVMEMAGLKQGLLPHDDLSLVSGAIVASLDESIDCQPSQHGSVVYLNGGDDLANVLARVESAGGKILMSKTHLGDEIGYIAQFIDSEGNRIGLHSKG